MTIDQGTEYQARARATLGAEMGQLVEMLTTDQLNALAAEVVREVLTNDRGFSEYVAEYVCNITYSSASDADRLRKLRSYADLMMTSEDRVEAVADHERSRWGGGGAGNCPDCGEYCREGDDCTSEHYAQTAGGNCNLEVCVDCAHLIANGETPEDRPEFELLGEWDGYHIALVLGDDSTSFSWAQCDGCGSRLGGDRHKAVAFEDRGHDADQARRVHRGIPGSTRRGADRVDRGTRRLLT